MRNDIRNIYTIPGIQNMAVGSHAFLWPISSLGYRLCNKDECRTFSESIDLESIDAQPPWLIPCAGEQWRGTPLKNRLLHREFTSISPEEDGIIAFAKKHGLLGHDVLLKPASSSGKVIAGESIQRWKEEMGLMGSLLALWDLVQFEDKNRLEQLIVWPTPDRVQLEIGWQYDGIKKGWKIFSAKWPYGSFSLIASRDLMFHSSVIERWHRGDVIEPAKYHVCSEVNKRISGYVSPQVLPFVQDRIYLFPKTLLAAMWLMFMWEITGETKVLLCPRCHQWVEQLDPRRKSCSNACKQWQYRERKKLNVVRQLKKAT